MKMTEVAVRRGVTFLMIYIIIVGFGLFGFSQLSIDLYPDLEFPVMAVITDYTGVSPFDIETVLTRPIEESLAAVENINTINSTSQQGLSLVMLEFDWGTNMDQAGIDVRNALDMVGGYLPDDASDPIVFEFNPAMMPIMYMMVNSDQYGLAELRRITEDELEPRLERIPGVASSFTAGGLAREIRIQVDPNRLRAHHVAIEQVSAALSMNNLQLPAGWIDNKTSEFTLQTAGEYTSIEQIENTAVTSINRQVIRVKDVATVVDGFQEKRQEVWNNGRDAVMLMIQKQSDGNTVRVCKDVKKRIPDILEELPKGIHLNTIFDQSEFINKSMSNLSSTAIQAIFLAFLVLLFFLHDIRSSLIVAISIPISIVLTFGAMYMTGLTLNVISMAGLALAVGLLVDNSIVVLESIFRKRSEDETNKESSVSGASEVAMAITASTLTTLAVFVPVLFVPGIAGEMFKEMVLVICFSLGVSLFVALTLIPLMTSRLMRTKEAYEQKVEKSRISKKSNNMIVSLQDWYGKRLKWAVHHRKTVLFSTLVLFIISLVIAGTLGGDFMPNNDQGYVEFKVKRTPGISLEEMGRTMKTIENIVKEDVPEVDNIYLAFGQGEGISGFFGSKSSSEGDFQLKLVKRANRNRSVFDIQDDLREKFKNLPDVDISFEQNNMMGSAGDIVVKLFGHELDVSKALATEMKNIITEIEGVDNAEISIQASKPELNINFDRQRIADFGMSTAQVGTAVSTNILGSVVTRYREGGNEYDVRVQLNEDAREDRDDVANIMLMTPMGIQIPLRAVADIEYSTAPMEITREDQERMVSININVSGRSLQEVTKDVNNVVDETILPNGYRFEIGGTAEDMAESFMYLGLAMLVAIALVYMVMASQFESFLDPFIILITIPLSFIGVAFALLITGTSLDVMALIGVIMLVGIVVNNGIVLVDYINQLRGRGMEMFEAIEQGGMIRMRPVLMTALTTILAMLPLGLGLGEAGETWAPMARSVMGGLFVSTALTLIIVPVLYAVMEILSGKRKKKREARHQAKAAKATA
ncbi:efflux RND transporter permease subunit [bacterium]|nr:efflux RND transporter permease subunit [bacterium]